MNAPLPAVEALPEGLATLSDHERLAESRVDPAAGAYLFGGAGDEITLRANCAAWDAIALLPRVLRPLGGLSTQVRLLGRTLAHPLLVAPMAYQRLAHADGEMALAHAAAAQGAGLVLSAQASQPLDAVARAFGAYPERGPLWFQLYLQGDRGLTQALIARAEAAGYEALVLTVDAPAGGVRDRERRAGFRLPADVAAVNLSGLAPSQTPLAQAATWADVQWLQGATRLPIVLKGVLHPGDAREAVAMGAAALIVSNHGGRMLDTAASTAHALPPLAEAVDGAVPLLVDGGIRRGTDVVKALALGAQAVLVGRPCTWGLANAGAVGVAHVLRLLRDEFEIALALCGCASPQDITSELLFSA